MKRYQVIAPDPPWWYADRPRSNGAPTYKLMKPAELVAMKDQIDAWADETCALCMWYTGPKTEEAMDLGRAWGFRWVTVLLTWCKTIFHPGQQRLLRAAQCDDWNVYTGPGRYTKHGTEYMGLWRRGSLPLPEDLTVRQVIHAPVTGEHSRKPDEAYQRIERLWPDATRMEVFTRDTRPGWDGWGDEAGKFGTVRRGEG